MNPNIWKSILSKNNDILNSNTSKTKKSVPKINCNGLQFIIGDNGIRVSIYELKENKLYNRLIKYFTIEIPTMMGYTNKIKLFKIKNAKVIFPRFGMLNFINDHLSNVKIINTIQPGKPPSVPFKWTGSFVNNQLIVASYIMNNCFNEASVKIGNAGVILDLEAGQGKTYLATGLIQKLQTKTLIVCHNKTIMYQWIDVLNEGYPNNKIACYFGGEKKFGDIVVGIINSLVKDDLYINSKKVSVKEFYSHFGYVIFDEVHEYSGANRRLIYNKAQSTYMIGLSATPNERDFGIDNINTWNCGNILDAKTIDGYTTEDIPFKGNVTKIAYTGPPEYTQVILNEKMGVVSHSQMVSQLCDDPYRIHMIVKTVFELRKSSKFIFVFCDRRKYLTKIKEELDIFEIASHDLLDEYDELMVKQLMGGSTSDDIAYAKEHSNIILTTYQYMGTGCSIPKMDAIILGTPRRKKSKQYINRIFRLGSDYDSVREIIDIVDVATHMKNQWYSRKKYYDEKKYPINVKCITWKDIELEMTEMGILVPDDYSDDEHDELEKPLDELEALLEKHTIL